MHYLSGLAGLQNYKNCNHKTGLGRESCIHLYKGYVNVNYFNVQITNCRPYRSPLPPELRLAGAAHYAYN